MTVHNVYNISNHGTMFFPGAAQCGDYNSMYTPLLRDKRDRNYDDDDENRSSSEYEHINVVPP